MAVLRLGGRRDRPGLACRYEIRVGGVLDSRRADWFGGLAAGWDGSQTVISVLLADQAAP